MTQRSSPDRPRSDSPESLGTKHLQRSTGSGVGIPVAAQSPTGRGPAASTGTDTAHEANEAQKGPEAPMLGFGELMRVIDEGALSGGAVPPRPDAGRPVQRLPDGEPGSASAAASRPLGLGAPLESAGRPSTGPRSMGMQSAPTVQRQLPTTDGSARPPVVPVFSPEAPTAPTLGTTEPTTLQRQQSSAPTPEPSPPSTIRASASTPLRDRLDRGAGTGVSDRTHPAACDVRVPRPSSRKCPRTSGPASGNLRDRGIRAGIAESNR